MIYLNLPSGTTTCYYSHNQALFYFKADFTSKEQLQRRDQSAYLKKLLNFPVADFWVY